MYNRVEIANEFAEAIKSKYIIVTTNINGEYNLPINLAEEDSYTFRCTYKGTDKYTGSNCMLREYCELPL